MILSKETREMHRNRIRRILVVKPDATILETQSLLDSGKNPLHLDKDYINKIIRAIRERQGKDFASYTINKVLAGFKEEIAELKIQLWVIINSKDSTNSEKTIAIKELRNSSKDLFDKMFDAGVFEKKLGKISVVEHKEEIDKLLEDV